MIRNLLNSSSVRLLPLMLVVCASSAFAGEAPKEALPVKVFEQLRQGKNQTVVVYGTSLSINGQWAKALGSWFDAAPAAKRAAFDVLVSNPPYIEADDAHLSQGDLRFEPAAALTDFGDGLSCIRALAEGGRHYLRAGGWLLIEHGFDQGDAARAILLANGFAEVATLQDWAGLDRITLGRWL